MYDFINLKNPIRTTPGLAEKALIALADWFEPGGIKGPGAWVSPGDEVIIYADHVFKPGFGFITFQLAPEKNSYDAKMIGETGMYKFANEVKLMLPGSYVTLHEEMFNWLGKAAILLIKDADCPNHWYQVGTDCVPARVAADFTTATTQDGNKGYMLTITNTAQKIYQYNGDLTYPGESTPIIARITGELVGSTVTLDATTSTTNGATVYEYKVYYNDNTDTLQQVILPDVGDTANFDTSILTDWNGAGIAVVLTITNAFTSDKTRTADIAGAQPLQLGGFDEGFDTGFDFNIDES